MSHNVLIELASTDPRSSRFGPLRVMHVVQCGRTLRLSCLDVCFALIWISLLSCPSHLFPSLCPHTLASW